MIYEGAKSIYANALLPSRVWIHVTCADLARRPSKKMLAEFKAAVVRVHPTARHLAVGQSSFICETRGETFASFEYLCELLNDAGYALEIDAAEGYDE